MRSFDARREFLDNLAAEMGIPDPSAVAARVLQPNVLSGLGPRLTWLNAGALVPHEHSDSVMLQDLVGKLKADATSAGGSKLPAIVADAETLVVLDGHHRLSALRAMGHAKVGKRQCLVVNSLLC